MLIRACTVNMSNRVYIPNCKMKFLKYFTFKNVF